jgi:hypothetical protein
MPRRNRAEEGGAQAGSSHWTKAEKQVALEVSLSASELRPTKKEAPDGRLKGVEVPLRACRNSLQAARARPLEAPLARGKVTPEQSVMLRCHPSRSMRLWETWLDIRAEVTSVIFEVPPAVPTCLTCHSPTRELLYMTLSPPLKVTCEFLDGQGQPPSVLVESKWSTSGREGVMIAESSWDAIGRASSRYHSGPQKRRLPSRSAGY